MSLAFSKCAPVNKIDGDYSHCLSLKINEYTSTVIYSEYTPKPKKQMSAGVLFRLKSLSCLQKLRIYLLRVFHLHAMYNMNVIHCG